MKKLLILVCLITLLPLAAFADDWMNISESNTDVYKVDTSSIRKHDAIVTYWVKHIMVKNSIIEATETFQSVDCSKMDSYQIHVTSYFIGNKINKVDDQDGSINTIKPGSNQEKIVNFVCSYND
ncbi:MAG: surface-adhesin E family protein [Cyanobacteriota bacterium]